MKVANKLYDKIMKYGFKRTCCKVYNKMSKKEERLYAEWRNTHELIEQERKEQKNTCFEKKVKFSIVVPLFESNEIYLQQLVESIFNQTYFNWELCLSDGGGKESKLKNYLEDLMKRDSRIKCIKSKEKLGISANTNAALAEVSGDYIVFADHDDLIAENALYECARAVNEQNAIEIIYTDEDKVSMDGKTFFSPHFKPDYNRDLLCSVNYFCHMVVVKKSLVDKIGGMRKEFDGAQDYDFVLRCVEQTKNIYHIPKVLYHWRSHKESTAENPESKRYAFEAGKRAIQEHYKRIGEDNVLVTETQWTGIYRSQYVIDIEPRISIIIYNVRNIENLKQCIQSILENNYKNYEILIVSNKNLNMEKMFGDGLKKSIKRVEVKKEWNCSKIKNFAAEITTGNYLLYLEADMKFMHEECIRELVGMCRRKDTGIVGGKIYNKNGYIEQAGMFIGKDGKVHRLFAGLHKSENGYFSRIVSQMEYSVISGGCMLIKKDFFIRCSGFDEQIKDEYADVDICLEARKNATFVVYNPYVEVCCMEMRKENIRTSSQYFNDKWESFVKNGDPYYNNNFLEVFPNYKRSI